MLDLPPTGSRWLADLSSQEAGRWAAAGAILAVPLGSTEQHGAHLPLCTDTELAVALCRGLADARPDVLIAPPLAYGSSGEHAGFAGTLSIGKAAVRLVVTELGRSAGETFAHLLFVSAHGGNAEPVSQAVATLRAESRDVLLHLPRWEGDPHAGHTETSLMLQLNRALVRPELAVAGDTRPLAELLPQLRVGGVRAVTETGVLGDPRGASGEHGRELLAELVARLVSQVAGWWPDPLAPEVAR